MAIAIEELLNILCPGASPARSSELQKAWLIQDAAGAKLAHEVLTAYGFDAKLYPEATSLKLYVTQPPEDAASEQSFAAALKHAHTLATIRQNLDDASSMTFVNAPGGKQVVIQFASGAAAPVKPAAVTPSSPIAPQAVSYAPAKKLMGKKAKNSTQDPFQAMAGPAIAKTSYPDAILAGKRQDGLWRQFYLYVRGNIATATAAFFMLVIVPAIIAFSLFTMTKTFLCRDFAVAKYKENHAWYCGNDNGP